jgi:hypothetical protein
VTGVSWLCTSPLPGQARKTLDWVPLSGLPPTSPFSVELRAFMCCQHPVGWPLAIPPQGPAGSPPSRSAKMPTQRILISRALVCLNLFFLISFIHMCIQCLGHFSPLPPPLLLPPTPLLPSRNYFALISNFVEREYKQ